MESLKVMNRFNWNKLEPLNIEYEDEEVFGDVVPQAMATKSITTSGLSAKTMSRQTSVRSAHSTGSTDGNAFVFEVKEQSTTTANLMPSMGFKRKWSKRKKDLKLRYRMFGLFV